MEKLRPGVHFSPKYGWINDPNGLVFYKGRYHIFYQHNPNGLVWDSMHWGHAVSSDLMNWEELPIALYPDEMGDIYSGSCIYDADNISGFGEKCQPPLLAFYTSHHPETKREQQCLAYSPDGETFVKYEGNPIIEGYDHTPARDPHVFANTVLGGFSMCITREDRVEFYHSKDLLEWHKTGDYFLPAYAFQGMIECPCMVFLKVEGGSETKAALLMSMDIPASEYDKFPEGVRPHSRLMQYFVGEFDGNTFQEDNPVNRPLLVDHGQDFYAGTVFANCEDTILMAWLGNSEESMKIPTEAEGFRGVLSFPRKLSLTKQGEEYHLKHAFIKTDFKEYKDVTFTEDEEGIWLTDHCVSEFISKDGLRALTNYNEKGTEK